LKKASGSAWGPWKNCQGVSERCEKGGGKVAPGEKRRGNLRLIEKKNENSVGGGQAGWKRLKNFGDSNGEEKVSARKSFKRVV